MNTNKKHKSKNKNKLIPNTSEKVDFIPDPETKDVNQESAVSKHVPVEEGVKEIMREDVIISSDKEVEPRKPKRNKNKKKADQDVTVEEKPEDKIQESTDKSLEKNLNVEAESGPNDDFITPTARKKKNKLKHSEMQSENTDKSTPQKEIKETESIILKNKNAEQDTAVSPVPEDTKSEQESKSSKKKNKKKKNRNDSERSDKAEEVLSCTAAFQKLLEPKNEKPDTVKETTDKIVDKPKNKDILSATELEKQTKVEDNSQKSKKKSKKGKTTLPHDHQTILTDSKPEDEMVQTKDTITLETPKIDETELSQDIKNESNVPTPKPKAKIAKPVERKGKNKSDDSNLLQSTLASSVDELSSVIREDISLNISLVSDKDGQKSSKNESENQNVVATPTKDENVAKITESCRADTKNKPDVLLSKHNDHDSQANVSLSQILDNKTKQPSLSIKSGDFEPLPEKEHLQELFSPTTEPKTKMSKADKKRKNKSDNQLSEVVCTTSSLTTETDPAEKQLEGEKYTQEIAKPDTTMVMQGKEKSQLIFEELIDISSMKPTYSEHISKQDTKSIASTVMPQTESETNVETVSFASELDNMLKVKPSDKKRKKSPMKRDIKDLNDIKADTFNPITASESESHLQQGCIQKTDESLKELKIAEESCQLVIETEVTPSEVQETFPIKSMEIKRKASPMKRDNKDISEIPQKQKEQDIPFDSKGQQEKIYVSKTDDGPEKSKILEQSRQLKEKKQEQIAAIPNVEEMCELKKDFVDTSSLNEELTIPAQKNKKRKKSPKPPQTHETETHVESIVSGQNIGLQKETLKQEADQKVIVDEKVSQTPEKVPDSIQYPRSLSQLLIDPNNNASISEIKSLDELNIGLFDVQKTPIIVESGNSPTTPEARLIHIEGPKITECTINEKENTDLKSKVLEVNKDMEVLRLSIERTLAGFTSPDEKPEDLPKPGEIKKDDSKTQELKQNIAPSELESIKTRDNKSSDKIIEQTALKLEENVHKEDFSVTPPVPARQDKGKGKSKKKNKHDSQQTSTGAPTTQQSVTSQSSSGTSTESKASESDNKTPEKTEQKNEHTQQKGKQSDGNEKHNESDTKMGTTDQKDDPIYSTINKDNQSQKNDSFKNVSVVGQQSSSSTTNTAQLHGDFEPIENFEDAMTSSIDDVNKSFEIIANESSILVDTNNPEISITEPEEDTQKRDGKDKINPVSQPKNLLGHPDFPVQSNRTDYKKEKNKFPNARQARVKIKDSVEIEPAKVKASKESQTESKQKNLKKDTTVEESVSCVTNENEEYVYKYSFRRVFLPNICHICKQELKTMRVPCNFCRLISYCGDKHKDEGWQQHQALCFAVSTLAHHKGQKHIYGGSKNLIGHDYRLFRMQTIIACEQVLKRKLVPWEQEALLYPRICADAGCREFRQHKLKDCEGCGQIAFCSDYPEHLPKHHQRWCKSYSLYHKLVHHQQTVGRLAPKLPTKVLTQATVLPDKINMVLASLYEEKIDMNDIQYAALTQIATAPLTAAYSYQLYSRGHPNLTSKPTFTIHLVGAELQYEADALNKWETLFLHLKPEVEELNVVMIGPSLNPSDLPLDLLGKVKLCANCRLHARRLVLHFQDKRSYFEYWDSNEFLTPDIVCAFNPSIYRATIYNGTEQWPLTVTTIFKQKCPFSITSYTMNELNRDLKRIRDCSTTEFKVVSDAKFNPFASVRPDRNFITDDEIPLLFKNFCFAVLCGD